MKKKQVNYIIKSIMKKQGVTQIEMAKAIGKKRANEISSRLMSNNMTINKTIEMLEVMGYEIVIQKRMNGVRNENQFVLERSDIIKN